jgi:hypothetical protein
VDQHSCPLRTQLALYFRFDLYLELGWRVVCLLSPRILLIRTVVQGHIRVANDTQG